MHPSPIYSIEVDPSSSTLFCGGGDRFVSVWMPVIQGNDASASANWHLVQRLGPHTGWVKDIYFDEESNVLYTIGCNYLYTWHRKDDQWILRGQSSIQSDPVMGCTLSSDLLCLCFVKSFRLVISGGVDGRIHLWDTLELTNPLFHRGSFRKGQQPHVR